MESVEAGEAPRGKDALPRFHHSEDDMVEHTKLVTWRIKLYASVAGSTDCGLGSGKHPRLVWSKLRALVEGARLATKEP
jgi:methionine synthase II (cobalamin-independent)